MQKRFHGMLRIGVRISEEISTNVGYSSTKYSLKQTV